MQFLSSLFRPAAAGGRALRETQTELGSAEVRFRVGQRWLAGLDREESAWGAPVLGPCTREAVAAACRRAVANLRQGSILELVGQREPEDLQASGAARAFPGGREDAA